MQDLLQDQSGSDDFLEILLHDEVDGPSNLLQVCTELQNNNQKLAGKTLLLSDALRKTFNIR